MTFTTGDIDMAASGDKNYTRVWRRAGEARSFNSPLLVAREPLLCASARAIVVPLHSLPSSQSSLQSVVQSDSNLLFSILSVITIGTLCCSILSSCNVLLLLTFWDDVYTSTQGSYHT